MRDGLKSIENHAIVHFFIKVIKLTVPHTHLLAVVVPRQHGVELEAALVGSGRGVLGQLVKLDPKEAVHLQGAPVEHALLVLLVRLVRGLHVLGLFANVARGGDGRCADGRGEVEVVAGRHHRVGAADGERRVRALSVCCT